MMNKRRILVAAMCLGLVAGSVPALAQTPPARIRGKIEAVDGSKLSILTREGAHIVVVLAEPPAVMTVKPVDLTTIGPGSYVGIATEEDGENLKAIEVLVFPEAMRGAGEGHYAWDLTPTSKMTNATVKATVQGRAGRDLELTYKDTATKITVPPGVPIVTFAPAATADLKPGAPVFLSATKSADGSFAASRIIVGTGGVAPPM